MTNTRRKRKAAVQLTRAVGETQKKPFVSQESGDVAPMNDEIAPPADEKVMIVLAGVIFIVCWISAVWAISNYLMGIGFAILLAVLCGIIGGIIATAIVLGIGVMFFRSGPF